MYCGRGMLEFVSALEILKGGGTVARRCWKGVITLGLQVPDENSKMTKPYFYISGIEDGEREPCSIANQDLLANDWYDVDEVES